MATAPLRLPTQHASSILLWNLSQWLAGLLACLPASLSRHDKSEEASCEGAACSLKRAAPPPLASSTHTALTSVHQSNPNRLHKNFSVPPQKQTSRKHACPRSPTAASPADGAPSHWRYRATRKPAPPALLSHRVHELTCYQRPVEQMTAEPVSMRGGEAGEICCGL